MKTGMAIDPEQNYIEALEGVPEQFDFVEIGIGEMEKDPEDIDAGLLVEKLEEKDLELVAHLPFRQPVATTVKEYNEAKLEYQEKILDLAAELGAEKAVLHANLRHGQEKEDVERELEQQITELDRIASEKDIELCVENIPFEEDKPAGLIELGELLESLGVSICLDTGHAYAETDQETLEEFTERFSRSISHLHVQDSRGEDEHLAVGHGDIDFEAFAEKLGDFDGTVTFEIFSPDYDYHQVSREKFLERF